MRPYQLATAAVLIAIAAVAMLDTRAGALPDPSAQVPGGLRGGWYPFWSATLALVTLVVVLYRSATTPQPAQGPFGGREGVLQVIRLVVPMLVLVGLIGWLGFYVAGALYLGVFARYIGGYRWVWTVASAVGIPAVIFFVFEKLFLVPLPKSFLYTQGFPF